MEQNNKGKGCLKIFLIILALGAILKLYDNYSFDRNAINGEWIYSTTGYNPFSMGGVIEKGNYPVNYLLDIKNDDTYKLYYGSPGFEKFKTEGKIKKHFWNGVILTNFDPKSDAEKDYAITNVKSNNGVVQSFCVENEQNDVKCDFSFSKK
jgi:hypothetical protein